MHYASSNLPQPAPTCPSLPLLTHCLLFLSKFSNIYKLKEAGTSTQIATPGWVNSDQLGSTWINLDQLGSTKISTE